MLAHTAGKTAVEFGIHGGGLKHLYVSETKIKAQNALSKASGMEADLWSSTDKSLRLWNRRYLLTLSLVHCMALSKPRPSFPPVY